MPFTPEIKNPGDLVKSKDWNEALQAIAVLFAKLDPATGHLHTGAAEDAPPIQQNGIADNAVVTSKFADGAVTEVKLQDNAVSIAKLQDNAVSNSKIQDGAVTLNKVAAGIIPANIGITVTLSLTNGASIPIPNGFTKEECVFFAFVKSILNVQVATFSCYANNGAILFTYADVNGNAIADVAGYATGVAIAKKGGWT
jgi:hypothetical protein